MIFIQCPSCKNAIPSCVETGHIAECPACFHQWTIGKNVEPIKELDPKLDPEFACPVKDKQIYVASWMSNINICILEEKVKNACRVFAMIVAALYGICWIGSMSCNHAEKPATDPSNPVVSSTEPIKPSNPMVSSTEPSYPQFVYAYNFGWLNSNERFKHMRDNSNVHNWLQHGGIDQLKRDGFYEDYLAWYQGPQTNIFHAFELEYNNWLQHGGIDQLKRDGLWEDYNAWLQDPESSFFTFNIHDGKMVRHVIDKAPGGVKFHQEQLPDGSWAQISDFLPPELQPRP